MTEFNLNYNELLKNNSFRICLQENNPEIPLPINLKIKKNLLNTNFQTELYYTVKKYKTFIEYTQKKYKLNWNKLKMFTNNFELLTYNNSKKHITSMVNYVPISRAYFKFVELIQKFNLIDNSIISFQYAALAEGPGGFVEAFINYRKKHFLGLKDSIYCITLKSSNVDIPKWDKIKKFTKSRKNNIHLCYGKDKTGNLYNLDNIIHFKNYINQKVDLVSGDGGFDYSGDFDNQEQITLHLIYCEIVSAFYILKKGGHFILKIFDIHTNITLQYLYLLNLYFKEVIIEKPFTSRPANSEKYLICKGFKTINHTNLNKLSTIVDKWDDCSFHTKYIHNLFNFNIDINYINAIKSYNINFAKKQIKAILKVLMCNKLNKKEIDVLIETQIIYCIYWCLHFKQSINFKSYFFKLFKS